MYLPKTSQDLQRDRFNKGRETIYDIVPHLITRFLGLNWLELIFVDEVVGQVFEREDSRSHLGGGPVLYSPEGFEWDDFKLVSLVF